MNFSMMGNRQAIDNSDDGAPFFVLHVDEEEKKREDVGPHEVGWNHAMPEDVFVHCFAFLGVRELAAVCAVNQSWRSVANDSTLWRRLDLSHIYSRVDDVFLQRLLSSPRFSQLEVLNLEGCSALTNKATFAIQRCRSLRELYLSDCHEISPSRVLDLARSFPLERLELYRCTDDYSLVPDLRAERPGLRLGFFWLEYCAHSGLDTATEAQAPCRHEGRFNDRGCWGRVRGRIVYDNRFYHRGGNFPREVLYSCQAHWQDDMTDPELHKCECCENLFRERSMCADLICRTCFDRENLQNKAIWIPLTAKSIDSFGFHDVVSRTLRIADRKNLPDTLHSYGVVPCRLDYKLPEGDEVKQVVDPANVPLSIFLESNRWRLDVQVSTIKDHLKRAAQAKDTRALLCFDSKEDIEVFADKRLILDGREGEENLLLTVQAWGQALGIMWPILLVMAAVLYFNQLFRNVISLSEDTGTTDYTALLANSTDNGLSPELALILAGALLLGLMLLGVLWWKFRDMFESMLKKFLALDILLIFMIGGGILVLLFASQVGLAIEVSSFMVLLWNFGMGGLASLYLSVPPTIHRFYLGMLNVIMAVMLLVSFSKWIMFFFVCLASLLDIVSELRPRYRFMAPFLIPSNVEFVHETPRILYQVGMLRLRAADLMMYGLLIGCVVPTLGSVTASFVVIAAALAVVVFALPFLGQRFRPLPAALFGVIAVMIFQSSVLMPYTLAWNFLSTTPVVFPPQY